MNLRQNWTASIQALKSHHKTMMLIGACIFVVGFVSKEWKEEQKESLDALESVARMAQLRLRVDEVGLRLLRQLSTDSTPEMANISEKAAATATTGEDIDEYIENLSELSSVLSDSKVVQPELAILEKRASESSKTAAGIFTELPFDTGPITRTGLYFKGSARHSQNLPVDSKDEC